MNKKLISVLTAGVLAGSLMAGCSSNNTSTDSNNTKIERTNKDELKKEAKELICEIETAYTVSIALLQVNSNEDMSKIEIQNFCNKQVEMLDGEIEKSEDFLKKIDENTEEYKALKLLEDASICLWGSYRDMIKYMDSGNYEDYKNAMESIKVSASTYEEYVSKYKDKFNPSKEDKEDTKENTEKGDDESDNTTRNKTTNKNDNENTSPKTTTNTNEPSNESSTTKNRSETTETEKVTHDCWRCGKKNVTNYDEHWLCDDCYLEKIAHEEVDEEEVPTGHDCAICGQKNVPNFDDAHGWLCDNCYLGANQVDDYVED